MRRHRDRGAQYLELVHGGEHRRPRVHHAELASERPLEIAVAAALAEAAPVRVHRHAARDHEVDRAERLRPHRFAEPGRAADGRRFREAAAETSRIEADEAARRREAWHRHEDGLAVLERAQPQGSLRGVGVALEPPRRLPLGERGRPGGRCLRADEIRDAVLDREGESGDPPGREPPPDPPAERVLGHGGHAAQDPQTPSPARLTRRA